MKKWKKSAASMLLLLLMVSVAACGRNIGTAADENAGTGNEAGVENNSGNTGLDGRPFDEILFDTDGDGIYDHTDVDGDGLLEEIGRDANDVVDDVVNGVTETGDTLMDGVDDVVDGGENGTDGTGNVDNNAVE